MTEPKSQLTRAMFALAAILLAGCSSPSAPAETFTLTGASHGSVQEKYGVPFEVNVSYQSEGTKDVKIHIVAEVRADDGSMRPVGSSDLDVAHNETRTLPLKLCVPFNGNTAIHFEASSPDSSVRIVNQAGDVQINLSSTSQQCPA